MKGIFLLFCTQILKILKFGADIKLHNVVSLRMICYFFFSKIVSSCARFEKWKSHDSGHALKKSL